MFVNMLAPHQMPHIQRSNTEKKQKDTERGRDGREEEIFGFVMTVSKIGWNLQTNNNSSETCTSFNIKYIEAQQLMLNRNLSPCVVSHGYIPAHALDSFHAVWNTHGVVNKRGLIHGHTHVSAVCLWSRPQRADVIIKQATEATEWLIPLTQRSFESIIMVSFIAVDPFGPGCVITC